MVKDKAAEAKSKYLDVNNKHWQQMKNMMMETVEVTYGLSKGPCRHPETWWWSQEVAETVRKERKIWKLEKKENRHRHESTTRRVNKKWSVISLARGKKQNVQAI